MLNHTCIRSATTSLQPALYSRRPETRAARLEKANMHSYLHGHPALLQAVKKLEQLNPDQFELYFQRRSSTRSGVPLSLNTLRSVFSR